jgi:hypothetical protein
MLHVNARKKTIGSIQIWSRHWEHDTARRQTKQKLHHGRWSQLRFKTFAVRCVKKTDTNVHNTCTR